MIVFSAFVPHSPLLMPTIGAPEEKQLEATVEAMRLLSLRLRRTKPDTIVIISLNNIQHETAFSVNLHDRYVTDLSEYGDLGTRKTFSPDVQTVDHIQRALRGQGIAVTLDSEKRLRHDFAVPLNILTERVTAKIIPISCSGLAPKEHAAFGRALYDIFSHSSKRIAILAAGDLSHALESNAPAGFHPEGKKFDDAVAEAIKQKSLSKILSLVEEEVRSASECAYRPLLVLFGIMEKISVRPEILSYESPHGVGYLVGQFLL